MDKSAQNASIALKKAKTSIEKILKMIDGDEYCIDILQQILAVQGLLKSSSEKILAKHLHTCFLDGMNAKDESKKNEMIEELIKVLKMKEKTL